MKILLIFFLAIIFTTNIILGADFSKLKSGDNIVFTLDTNCIVDPPGFQITSDLFRAFAKYTMVPKGATGKIVKTSGWDQVFLIPAMREVLIELDKDFCRNSGCQVTITRDQLKNKRSELENFIMLNQINP